MNGLPEGVLTFLFTNIDGGTARWEQSPETLAGVLARQEALIRQAVEAHGGNVFKTVEDACYAVFSRPVDALAAAIEAQRALRAEAWDPRLGAVHVRIGIHTGQAERRGADYFGQPLNRTARILYAGSGGQILVSATTAALVGGELPSGASLRDLGEHRLKDLLRPEHIFQLDAPDLPGQFPPIHTLEFGPNNLPVASTPLLGRERDLVLSSEILRQPDVRALTITGAAGVGKTRLALATAADLTDEYPGGSYFIPLAEARAEEIVPRIAEALGVRGEGGAPPDEGLREFVRKRRLLLVLDSPEPVIVPVARLASDLLATAPDLKLIVASRVALRVRGERDLALSPFPTSDPHHLPTEDAAATPVLQLFAQQAKISESGLFLAPSMLPMIAQICARVDGLPLAVELAAERARDLGLPETLRRLSLTSPSGVTEALSVLVGGGEHLPARHRSFFEAIAWSYHLLSEGERALFRRLSVFDGSFSFEGAEVVTNAGAPLDADLFDGLGALVDASFIRRDESDDESEVRFDMLGLYREFGLKRLEGAGEAIQVRAAHDDYMRSLRAGA